MMSRFCVIIVAAGRSKRFGGEQKKSFTKLDGRPVFLRSLEHFVTRADVCQTILAVAPEDLPTVKSSYGPNLGFMNVQLVEGGERRCDTVQAALNAVKPEAEYVAVHDAARPCVTAEQIDEVFASAVRTGAAILAVPVTETLKRVSDSKVISETVAHTSLYAAQTPQVFRRQILMDAYAKLSQIGEEVTDDAQLVELAGCPVSVVDSDAANLKITTRGDFRLASAVLKSLPAKRVARLGAFEEAQW